MLDLIVGICDNSFKFEHFEECSTFYKGLINSLKQMNYSVYESEEFFKFEEEVKSIINERKA